MSDINHVILSGEVLNLRNFSGKNNKPVTSFRIGVLREGYQYPTRFPVVYFGETKLKEGDTIIVSGSLNVNSWVNKNGEKQYTTQVTAYSLQAYTVMGPREGEEAEPERYSIPASEEDVPF